MGKDLWTGGISWTEPVADISDHLVDGVNDIVLEYSSSLSNVQLDRGVVTPTAHLRGWWKNTQDYRSHGPRQARTVPFVQLEYRESWASALQEIGGLLAAYVTDGTISDRTAGNLRERLDRAVVAAQAGREAPALGYLQQFVARMENQVKGDAADLAARAALVAAARAVLRGLQALDDSEGWARPALGRGCRRSPVPAARGRL
ncbi:FIMAH domain-containing protein [Motilibacter aurantiacus]|uniref:FIMAH domain-containing protein n=1 Tax=Motilibacter aurantiacus TaxID=2714955 RepID=UPI00140E21AB|nr:hypothetical protein [Motilibacter aurantiacus]NHC45679.1 hypothetical protein [Motilibacter aurantiacus]